jgi:hypothetical protein
MTRQGRTVLFALAGKADADNIAPAIWALARDGHAVAIQVVDADVFSDLQSAWWLPQCSNIDIELIKSSTSTRVLKRLYQLRWNRWFMRRMLRQLGIRLVVMEWKEGVAHRSPKRWQRITQWLATDFFLQLQLAAQQMNISTVALPHGHSTKTTIIRSQHVQAVMDGNSGRLPFADRDSHAAYVFASTYHREVIVGHSTMSGNNTQVWGSARFNDEWVPRLYGATTAAQLPPLRPDQLRRVLFFVPKWHNLVDKQQTLQLIAELGTCESLQLVVRGHLRASDTTLTEQEVASLKNIGNIVLVGDNTPSPSLIKACDVLVDTDSSIAFDAVLLGKPYVRPRYLQDASVRTIWDTLGGAHQTDSLIDTIALLTDETLSPAPRDPQFEQVVFGGAGVDVLRRYRDGLLAIAASE